MSLGVVVGTERSGRHLPRTEDLLLPRSLVGRFGKDGGRDCVERGEKKTEWVGEVCSGLLHTLETVSFQGPCPSWSRRTVSLSSSIRTESCRFIFRSISLSTFLPSFCR